MRVRLGAFVVIAIGAAVAACQVIAGIERVDKVSQPLDGATSTSSSSGAVQNPNDPCQHVLPPPRPAKDDPGSTGDVSFYVATKTLSLTKPALNGISGIDLDGACTCDTRKGAAFDGGSSCGIRSGSPGVCDGDGGIDNQGLSLFSTIFADVQLATHIDYEQSLNDDITAGKRTLMLYIRDWNGLKNDTDVSTTLFISDGTLDSQGTGTPPTPKFDGTDVWTYPDNSTIASVNGKLSPQATQPGYVANGRLVVQNNVAVTIVFGTAGLVFGDSVVFGDLGKDPSTGLQTFTGIIGGRIKQSDLLGAAGQIRASNDDYVCNAKGSVAPYPIVQSLICPAADIMGTRGNDFTNQTCDSISATLAIQSIEATIGGTATPTDQAPNPCAPGQPNTPDYKCN